MTRRREVGTTGRSMRSMYQYTLDTDEYIIYLTSFRNFTF